LADWVWRAEMHHRNPTECVCRSGTATLLQEELISSARADSEWLRLRTSLQCLLPIQVGLVPAHDRCQMLNQKNIHILIVPMNNQCL